jgi:hypothetical protein
MTRQTIARSMRSLRRPLLSTLAAAAALVAGCATPQAAPPTDALLTYVTVPPGATLYEGKEQIGIAPVTRRYGGAKGGEITTPDVTAVWPSGAKVPYFTVLKPGDDRVATLSRPASAPGLDVDVANGEKVAKEAEAENARRKQSLQADVARSSARCQQQLQSGKTSGVDNCS